jgi:DNA-binding transcriptional ArsR family regulator
VCEIVRAMDTVELVAHPVRLRIIHAMRGGRTLTTSELCVLLPGVSKATVYRHIDVLAAAGILEVAGEQRVRGAVERRYRLRQDQASVSPETFKSVSREDHRRAFAAAMAALLAEFNAYLDHDDADPPADQVGYQQRGVWLTGDELLGLITGLRQAIAPVLDNPATPDRTRYLISPILFPAEKPSPADVIRPG